jgi:hypothetical protein
MLATTHVFDFVFKILGPMNCLSTAAHRPLFHSMLQSSQEKQEGSQLISDLLYYAFVQSVPYMTCFGYPSLVKNNCCEELWFTVG